MTQHRDDVGGPSSERPPASSAPARASYASLLAPKGSPQPKSSQPPPVPPKPPSVALAAASESVQSRSFDGPPPPAPPSTTTEAAPPQPAPKAPLKPAWGAFKAPTMSSAAPLPAPSAPSPAGIAQSESQVAAPAPPTYADSFTGSSQQQPEMATVDDVRDVNTSEFKSVLPADAYDWDAVAPPSPPTQEIHIDSTSSAFDPPPFEQAPPDDHFASELRGRLEHVSPKATAVTLSATPPAQPSPDFTSWDVSSWDANVSRWRQKGWLLPRMLAVPDEMGIQGQTEYLWNSQPWNFRVEEKVPEGKYHPWGSIVDSEGNVISSETSSAPQPPVEVGPTSEGEAPQSQPVQVDAPRKHAIETVSLDEVKAARPHKDFYFNPVTRSWVLFAPIPARTDAPLQSSPSPYETFRPCLPSAPRVSAVELPAPFQPTTVSQLTPDVDWDASHEGRQDLTVWEGTKGHDALVSAPTFFPLVINEKLWEALEQESEPAPGETTIVAFHKAVYLIWRVLDGLLFVGSNKSLPVHGKTFRKSIDWSEVTSAIFVDTLGFTFRENDVLTPPKIGKHNEEELLLRRRLIRAWLECGLMLECARRLDLDSLPKNAQDRKATRIAINPPKYLFGLALGGDQLPRVHSQDDWTTVGAASGGSLPVAVEQYDLLGSTADVSDIVVLKAYEDQIHFHSENGPTYLGALTKIGQARNSEEINTHVAIERSQGRKTQDEINSAYAELGAGPEWTEEALMEAYSNGRETAENNIRKDQLKDALSLLAEARNSDFLKQVLQSMDESLMQPQMSLPQAYRMFDLTEDVDDGMLEMMYSVALGDQPQEADKLKKAMQMIADSRSSPGLRALVGSDSTTNADSMALVPFGAQEEGPPPREDGKPVGLTNIANTCYLNSLLQFLFNVKELRDAVLAFEPAEKSEAGEKKEQRVGGRLVTEEEVDRSNRFVGLLQELFKALVESETASVTPATELAYLALVTSSNKPDDAGSSLPALDSIADEGAQRANTPVPDLIQLDTPLPELEPATTVEEDEAKSPSILGKRRISQTNGEGGESMQVDALSLSTEAVSSPSEGLTNQVDAIKMDESGEDTLMPDADAAITPTIGSPSPTPEASQSEEGHAARVKRSRSVDVVPTPTNLQEPLQPDTTSALSEVIIPDSSDEPLPLDEVGPVQGPPPLPPRPMEKKELDLEREVSNAMAFGLQNDVTEAQDNIMFQIETSQSKFTRGDSTVKSMFFGKQKQTLQFDDPSVVPDPLRTTTVPFLSLGVRVPLVAPGAAAPRMDLYEGLDKTFEDQQVTSEGHSATLKVTLLELPPMLQIQLQRVDYDREARKVVKSNAHLSFPKELSLDRYLEADEADADALERHKLTREKRQEIDRVQKRLAELGKDSAQSENARLLDLHAYLSKPAVHEQLGLTPSDQLLDEILQLAAKAELEVTTLERSLVELKAELEAIWAGQRKAPFELTAVFIHRGTASSGHYFVYLLNREEKEWYKFNDATVTRVEEDEIFREATGDSNAYFLGYAAVRDQPQQVKQEEQGQEQLKMEEVVEQGRSEPEEEQPQAGIDWEAERKAAEEFEKSGALEGW